MDALEGYEAAGKNQQPNLNELSERLQQRTTVKKGRIIPWKVWSIAASVIVVLTIGGLWLKKTPPAQKVADVALPVPDKTKVEPSKDTLKVPAAPVPAPLIAQNAKPAAVLKPAGKPTDKAVYQQEISAADTNVPLASNNAATVNTLAAATVKPQAEKKDNTQQLSEVVVMNYTQQSKQDSTENAELARGKARSSAATVDSKLQGKVASLTVITSKDSKTQFGPGRIAGTNISGIIISKDDGQPIIGAAIRIKGTNKSTVTDTNGKFAISAPAGNKETLDIVYIGYDHTFVSAQGGDSLKVELKPNANSLSEVVVGYGVKKDADEPAAENAHPQDGWSSFKKYLQTNTFLPDGTTGSVSVTFTVDTNGTLSDFKVKKSLNASADQKAIDLIKAGPSWLGNNNRKPEQVTVKVKFQKQK
jgi:TonB family protein